MYIHMYKIYSIKNIYTSKVNLSPKIILKNVIRRVLETLLAYEQAEISKILICASGFILPLSK